MATRLWPYPVVLTTWPTNDECEFHSLHHPGSIMAFLLKPWQLYFLALAGLVNRQQQELIEYLRTENQVLKEKLGKKRILLNDDQGKTGSGRY